MDAVPLVTEGVPFASVLRCLRDHGVRCDEVTNTINGVAVSAVMLSKGDIQGWPLIPEPYINRTMLGRLSRKFGVPVADLWGSPNRC